MHEVKMPQLGQSVEEAAIVQWLKSEGDSVAAGEPLFSVQTDKAEIECESPVSGILRKILAPPDVYIPVLTVVAWVGEANEPLPALPGVETAAPTAALVAETPGPLVAEPLAAAPVPGAGLAGGKVPASPRSRARAEELGVNLAAVAGSGPGGRVLAADVENYAASLAGKRVSPTARRVAEMRGVDLAGIEGTGPHGKVMKEDVLRATAQPAAVAKPAPSLPAVAGGVRRVPLTPMRRIIAQRMSESKYSAPHYYITVEIDMASAKAFRATQPQPAPSFNDLVLYAVVRALREFPNVNARWAGDAIEEVADINLGVAVALPAGLIVPVIKQAQNLSLDGLRAQCKALADRARNGKLLPDDYVGNTFTVSNLGPFGVDHFTAIINQPDSAILAVGQMKDRPVVVDGGIFVRPIMKATISSDHRVIDGSVAAQFMGRFREILEVCDF